MSRKLPSGAMGKVYGAANKLGVFRGTGGDLTDAENARLAAILSGLSPEQLTKVLQCGQEGVLASRCAPEVKDLLSAIPSTEAYNAALARRAARSPRYGNNPVSIQCKTLSGRGNEAKCYATGTCSPIIKSKIPGRVGKCRKLPSAGGPIRSRNSPCRPERKTLPQDQCVANPTCIWTTANYGCRKRASPRSNAPIPYDVAQAVVAQRQGTEGKIPTGTALIPVSKYDGNPYGMYDGTGNYNMYDGRNGNWDGNATANQYDNWGGHWGGHGRWGHYGRHW